GIGGTYTASNGLTLSSSDFQLGGTLTQNTSIGTSSFGLSFLGLGNTQALYISSSGNVGIGTTDPNSKLQILGGINVGTGGYTSTFNGNLYLQNNAVLRGKVIETLVDDPA